MTLAPDQQGVTWEHLGILARYVGTKPKSNNLL